MNKRSKILLADDHAVILDGLRSLLEPEFEVVGSVEDGRALIDAVKSLRPDLVLADISMPLLNGIDAARQLKKDDPRMKLIILTMHPDVSLAREALQAGADGYILKNSHADEIVSAIREVLIGRTYLSPRITQDVLHSYMDSTATADDLGPDLSAREREVLQLTAEGMSHKDVANTLGISVRTAQFHRYKVMQKLGLRTTSELTKYAIKHGITTS